MVDINPKEIKGWFTDVLPEAIRWRGYQGSTRCPLPEHGSNDRNPSFTINAEKGVWSCKKENRSGNIKDLAELLGKPLPTTWQSVPMKHKSGRAPAASYGYRDEAGRLLFQVLRYEPKAFSQRRPDDNEGWISNLEGVKRVPYRLPELIAAMNRNETIYVVEGEKDADTLSSLGLVATCNSGGAGKWTAEHSKYFGKGVSVAILPDNDSPGRKHGESVAMALKGQGCRVKVVLLPGLPEKGDVSDWLVLGHGKDELLEAIARAPDWGDERRLRLMNHLREPNPSEGQLPEMIGGMFPRGYLAVVTADSGAGKTWLLLRVACDLSRGGEVLDGLAEHDKPMKVLFLEGDFGPGLIEARLKQTGFERGPGFKVLYKSEVEQDGFSLDLGTLEGQENLRVVIESYRPDIAFLDTVSPFHGLEENDNTAMKPIFQFCNRLAAEYDLAFVAAHHARKPKRSEANMPLTQHDTVGASVIQRIVSYMIGMEAHEENGRKAHVVRVLKSWFKQIDPFAFFLEDGEVDGSGFPSVLMHVEFDYDPQGVDKLAQLWGIVQRHYGDGNPFSKGMLERWTDGAISGRALKGLLPRLVRDGRLIACGATRNRQYQISRIEKDPIQEEEVREGEFCPNRLEPIGITGFNSDQGGVRIVSE